MLARWIEPLARIVGVSTTLLAVNIMLRYRSSEFIPLTREPLMLQLPFHGGIGLYPPEDNVLILISDN